MLDQGFIWLIVLFGTAFCYCYIVPSTYNILQRRRARQLREQQQQANAFVETQAHIQDEEGSLSDDDCVFVDQSCIKIIVIDERGQSEVFALQRSGGARGEEAETKDESKYEQQQQQQQQQPQQQQQQQQQQEQEQEQYASCRCVAQIAPPLPATGTTSGEEKLADSPLAAVEFNNESENSRRPAVLQVMEVHGYVEDER